MNIQDTIRSWKDEDFRSTTGASNLAENPAGLLELRDDQLDMSGGMFSIWVCPSIDLFGCPSTDLWGGWGGCQTGDFVPCATQGVCTFDFMTCPDNA